MTRLLIKHNDLRQALISGTILSTGFFAMSCQMIVLFLFQSLCGYLFSWLAILTASFMFGASLGALYAQKKMKALKTMHQLSQIEIIFPFLTTTILLAAIALNNAGPNISMHVRWLLCLTSISTGVLSGLELPMCFNLSEYQIKNPSKIAGTLYGLDLLGACLGVLLTPLILIPSCGIIPTALLLCLLKWGNGWNIDAFNKKMP
jgi:spermidine synthase